MIASIAGELAGGTLGNRRPFRAPHHSASMAALVGGGIARPAGRGVARPSRRAVPRRVAGVHAAGARLAAPAARDRRDRDRARQPPHQLSRAHPAGRRDEPLPLRPRRRAGPCAAAQGRALRRATTRRASRAPARPHRPADRGAGGDRRRPRPAAAGRGQRARSRARVAARARDPGRALRRASGLPGLRTNAECDGSCSRRSPRPTRRADAAARRRRGAAA